MTDGTVRPDATTFAEQAAGRRVVPVTRRLLADAETPVGVYRKLGGGPGTFLLESAEQGVGSTGMTWSRYSFIGVRSAATLTERDGVAVWTGQPPAGLPAGGDPVAVLRDTVAALAGPPPDDTVGLPPLTGGMVGYLGYDLVRHFERLPERTEDDLGLPALGMMLATDLVVLDHYDGSALLVANAVLPPPEAPDRAVAVTAAYHHAVGRLDAMTAALSRPIPPMASTVGRAPVGDVLCRTPAGGYQTAVLAAKEAIRAGECFQIVLAQRFERETDADPLDVYRVLRTTNPSPYMYLLRFDGFDIVGSSPEAHLKVSTEADGQRRALLHPRARNATPCRTRRCGRARPPPRRAWRAPRRRAARRPQGTLGARDAGGPWPQRSGAGLPTRHGRGTRVRHDRAVQPRDAHRLHGGRRARRGPHRL